MTTWQYKYFHIARSHEPTGPDGGGPPKYGPFESPSGATGDQRMEELQALGREGWEMVGLIPAGFMAEPDKDGGFGHELRLLAYTLVFKRPLE